MTTTIDQKGNSTATPVTQKVVAGWTRVDDGHGETDTYGPTTPVDQHGSGSNTAVSQH